MTDPRIEPPPTVNLRTKLRGIDRPWADRTPRDRRVIGRGHRGSQGQHLDGTIDVYCWCEQHIAPIPATDIGRTTWSCGRPRCHPPTRPNVQ